MLLLFMDMLDNEPDKLLFSELWDRNKQGMYHLAYQILQDSGLAEDAVQEAFFKLAEHFSHYQKNEKEQLDHLCFVLVKTKALDIQRKRSHSPVSVFQEELFELEASASSENPEEQILLKEEKRELYDLLRQALQTLSEREYHALVLRHFHHFKSRQIAELLDMNVNAVDVLLYRTYQKLKKAIQKEQQKNN